MSGHRLLEHNGCYTFQKTNVRHTEKQKQERVFTRQTSGGESKSSRLFVTQQPLLGGQMDGAAGQEERGEEPLEVLRRWTEHVER